jgi:hypothetical protein
LSEVLTNPYRFVTGGATYETDFSDDSDWSSGTSGILEIDTTEERLDFNLTADNINAFIQHDMGAGNVSNTEWVLRYKIYWSKIEENSTSNTNTVCEGLYNQDDPTGQIPTGDALRFCFSPEDAPMNFLEEIDDGTRTRDIGNADPFTFDSTGTTYYVEIIRLSATSIQMKAFTGSFDGSQVGTTMSLTAGGIADVTALQFITIQLYSGLIGDGEGQIGYIKNLQFWNDTTTPT